MVVVAPKTIKFRYFETAEETTPYWEFPLDEDNKNSISFSHEWWHPVREVMEFVQTVIRTMDLNYISAVASLAEELPRLLGASIKPLNYFAKAWRNPGKPFTIDLSVSFRFGQNGKYNAYIEVVEPVMRLITRTVPVFKDDRGKGTLIQGPGPTPLNIFASVVTQMTSLQAVLPGKGKLTKELRDNERRRRANTETYNAYKEWLSDENQLTPYQVKELLRLSEKYPETLEYLRAYIFGGSFDDVYKQNTEELQQEIDQITIQSQNGTLYQLPRTWELRFNGYVFRYLVCINSTFTFSPEVDSDGFPIRGIVTLSFQPYMIALANTIGYPTTGERVTIGEDQKKAVLYGWSGEKRVE